MLTAWKNIRDFRASPLHMLQAQAARQGPYAPFQLGPRRAVLITDPAMIERVLVHNVANYNKQSRGYQFIRRFLGNGLLTSEGSFWLRQRRLAQPAFHKERLQRFVDVMVDSMNDAVAQWCAADSIDLTDAWTSLTARIACRTLFSLDPDHSTDGKTIGDAIQEVLVQMVPRVAGVSPPMWLPTPANRRMKKATAILNDFVYRIIADRRALLARGDAGPLDFLGMMMAAVVEDTGETMSDAQLRDEVLTLYMAGHETTANSMCFGVLQMMTDEKLQQRLRADVDATTATATPTMSNTAPLLSAFIQEALRLYPAAPLTGRLAVADDSLGGPIRSGDIIFLSPYVTHRLPHLWDRADVFDVDRVAPPDQHKYSFFPFSGGQRKCIGDQFALVEQRVLLTLLLQQCRFSPVGDVRIEPAMAVTLRNGPTTRLRVRRRETTT
jgi:cytochrome P450